MALTQNNITILSELDPRFSATPIVASGGATTIVRGNPTKAGSAGAVATMVDGDGTTSQVFTGIAKSDSTDTAAAAGNVTIWLPLPGYMYASKAKSATAADTQAEIDALFYKRVVFDLTSSLWTIDTAAASASTNCVVIVGGDYRTSTIYFMYGVSGSLIS